MTTYVVHGLLNVVKEYSPHLTTDLPALHHIFPSDGITRDFKAAANPVSRYRRPAAIDFSQPREAGTPQNANSRNYQNPAVLALQLWWLELIHDLICFMLELVLMPHGIVVCDFQASFIASLRWTSSCWLPGIAGPACLTEPLAALFFPSGEHEVEETFLGLTAQYRKSSVSWWQICFGDVQQ
jgi:hypothetical protein